MPAIEIEATFVCMYCLQVNTILIDSSAGLYQEYIEDCEVCCKPNRLIIRIDEELKTADVGVEMC
jgi:hypothetical protein